MAVYMLDDVLASGEIILGEANSVPSGDVARLVDKLGLQSDYDAWYGGTLSSFDFARKLIAVATDDELIAVYGTPLEDFHVGRFRLKIEGG